MMNFQDYLSLESPLPPVSFLSPAPFGSESKPLLVSTGFSPNWGLAYPEQPTFPDHCVPLHLQLKTMTCSVLNMQPRLQPLCKPIGWARIIFSIWATPPNSGVTFPSCLFFSLEGRHVPPSGALWQSLYTCNCELVSRIGQLCLHC